MFWSNVELKKQVKSFDWGEYPFVRLGEFGRGRRPVNICTANTQFETLNAKEEYPKLSLVYTKTNNLKFVPDNRGIFIGIDTLANYVRGAKGEIQIAEITKDKVKTLGFGWGAFGDAGRIGTGDAAVFQCTPGAIIRFVRTRMSEYEYIFIQPGKVMYFGSKTDLDAAIDSGIVELPETTWHTVVQADVITPPPQPAK